VKAKMTLLAIAVGAALLALTLGGIPWPPT
jgi:hypothetical protein